MAGTSLLSHTKILDPDDRWLFLPALERVKRISSANKSLMRIENHQNGKSTDLVFAEWTFANGLEDGEMTPSRLRRAR